MTVHIVARHVKLTKALKDFIQKRVDKFQHYFDHIVWAQVILGVEKKTNSVEIVVHAAKQTFKSSAAGEDMYGAIEASAVKMEAQIKKYKERKKDHRAIESDDISADIAMPAAEVRFSVVKQVPVEPMTADRAAVEMDRLGYAFWLFLDEETNKINVIFKRQDNSFGLLQPSKKN